MLYKKYYCTAIEKELKKVIEHAVFKRLGSGYHSAFHIFICCASPVLSSQTMSYFSTIQNTLCASLCVYPWRLHLLLYPDLIRFNLVFHSLLKNRSFIICKLAEHFFFCFNSLFFRQKKSYLLVSSVHASYTYNLLEGDGTSST